MGVISHVCSHTAPRQLEMSHTSFFPCSFTGGSFCFPMQKELDCLLLHFADRQFLKCQKKKSPRQCLWSSKWRELLVSTCRSPLPGTGYTGIFGAVTCGSPASCWDIHYICNCKSLWNHEDGWVPAAELKSSWGLGCLSHLVWFLVSLLW